MQVGRMADRPGELIEGGTLDQLSDGSVDVAFLCGLPYVRLRRRRAGMLRPLAAPVLDEPRSMDQPVYFSDVIVRRDSPARSFADLRGRSWAHNGDDSFSGCLLVRYHLLQLGESEAFFGRVTFSGSHQESIRSVLDGEVDASAIDSQVLGVERLRNPDLQQQLRVVASLGPSTVPPVVATAGLSEEMQSRVREGLCELGAEPESRRILSSGLIKRFTPIEDRAYDDIRHKLDAVQNSVAGGDQLAGLGP